MAKQKKQFFILAGVLLVVLAVYGAVMNYNKSVTEQEDSQKEAEIIYITEIQAEEIISFSYTYDEDSYAYTKNGDVWTYDEDTSLDLDEATIENMLSSITYLTAEDAISEYASLETYGFSEPEKIITLFTEKDTVVIKVGDYNEIVEWYYLIKEGDEMLYLVDSNFLSTFDVLPQDFVVEETDTETEITEEITIE